MVTPCLLTTTWEFDQKGKIKMEDNLPKLITRHENNEFLTSLFIWDGVRGKKLAQLSKCWLYLQVMTLADIITGDCNYIPQSISKGEWDPYCQRYYQWPRQGWASEAAWSEWQSFLCQAVGCIREQNIQQIFWIWVDKDKEKWYWWHISLGASYGSTVRILIWCVAALETSFLSWLGRWCFPKSFQPPLGCTIPGMKNLLNILFCQWFPINLDLPGLMTAWARTIKWPLSSLPMPLTSLVMFFGCEKSLFKDIGGDILDI